MDHHPDPGRANRTAEGHLRPHAAVCARRRAISCTRRHSASSRTGSDTTTTAYTNVNSPAPIPPRVSRELEHEGYVEMPGRTRGETRALRDASRDYAHRHGIPLDHAAMVSMLAKGEATNEIVRQHGASKDSLDLPTAHASDLPTPNMCPTWRSRPMLTYGDTPCTRNSMVFYRQVPSRRRRPSN